MLFVGRLGMTMEEAAKLDRLGDDALYQRLEPLVADHVLRLTRWLVTRRSGSRRRVGLFSSPGGIRP